MKDQIEGAKATTAINLADVADFEIGALQVQPSLRRVKAGTREESVEPRVMQALVALVEAGETVVSRDLLIDRCWSGRIVGDDAINRCIAKVRGLAETAQSKAFTIETISKVGYRLKSLNGVSQVSAEIGLSPSRVVDRLPVRPKRSLWRLHKRPELNVIVDWVCTKTRQWRAAGIAALVVIVATAAAVMIPQPTSPVNRAPMTVMPTPFNPPPYTVAVLAFANLSGNPAEEYLSDSLSEEVIDVLSRVSRLQVTARTSSFFFKGKAATIDEIARRLNVGSVLEGSVRREGSRLRISARLSDGRTGYELWSQSYDQDQLGLLEVQSDIAAAVTHSLQIKLLDADAAKLTAGGTSKRTSAPLMRRSIAENSTERLSHEATTACSVRR